MRKSVTISLGVCLMAIAVGCTGPFALTKKLHEWQTSFDDKWKDEVVFLGCVILPVYSLASVADAVVLNSYEFWKGKSLLSSKTVETDGATVQITRHDGDVLEFRSGPEQVFLERGANGVTVRDADHRVVCRAVKGDDFIVRAYDADGVLVSSSN